MLFVALISRSWEAGLLDLPELPVLPPSAAEEEKGMRGLDLAPSKLARAPAGGLAALLHLLLFRYDR
jgi:hypothetical protein